MANANAMIIEMQDMSLLCVTNSFSDLSVKNMATSLRASHNNLTRSRDQAVLRTPCDSNQKFMTLNLAVNDRDSGHVSTGDLSTNHKVQSSILPREFTKQPASSQLWILANPFRRSS